MTTNGIAGPTVPASAELEQPYWGRLASLLTGDELERIVNDYDVQLERVLTQLLEAADGLVQPEVLVPKLVEEIEARLRSTRVMLRVRASCEDAKPVNPHEDMTGWMERRRGMPAIRGAVEVRIEGRRRVDDLLVAWRQQAMATFTKEGKPTGRFDVEVYCKECAVTHWRQVLSPYRQFHQRVSRRP